MQKQVTAKNGTTAYKGLKIDAITSQFRLQQLIIKPNHLTGNSSSCIDLILSSLSNLVWIVFLKFNLKFFYHHLTNVKLGITIRLMLTLFADQSLSSLAKTYFLRQM